MFASLQPADLGLALSLAEGLAAAERYGFGGYDPDLEALHAAVEAEGAQTIREAFLGRGLRVGAWHLPFDPVAVSDEAWQTWLRRLPPLLASAAAVGARRAGLLIAPADEVRGYAVNFEHHVARCRPVARLLADRGIRLGLEFLGTESARCERRYPFIHTLAGVRELGAAIGPNCGVRLDSWHWQAAGGTTAELAALPAEQIVHVQVSDAPVGVARGEWRDDRRQLPGTTGVLDLDAFIQTLAEVGYDGPVTAEPHDFGLAARPHDEVLARTAAATRGTVARATRSADRWVLPPEAAGTS